MTEIFLGRPYGSGDSPRICSDLGRCYWKEDLCMEGTQEQSWYERLLHQPVLEKKKRNTGLFCLRLSTGVLAWNSDQLSSGSCDCTILQRDTRTSPLQSVRRLKAHKREVCGLKWNSDRKLLASGDNDNKVEFCSLIFSWLFYCTQLLIGDNLYFQLLVWNQDSPMPLQTFKEHQGAVKAIAWSPHQRSLLASGGGSADCSIRIWSSLQLEPVQRVDTGSQVCNLVWSKHTNELVSDSRYTLDTLSPLAV